MNGLCCVVRVAEQRVGPAGRVVQAVPSILPLFRAPFSRRTGACGQRYMPVQQSAAHSWVTRLSLRAALGHRELGCRAQSAGRAAGSVCAPPLVVPPDGVAHKLPDLNLPSKWRERGRRESEAVAGKLFGVQSCSQHQHNDAATGGRGMCLAEAEKLQLLPSTASSLPICMVPSGPPTNHLCKQLPPWTTLAPSTSQPMHGAEHPPRAWRAQWA